MLICGRGPLTNPPATGAREDVPDAEFSDVVSDSVDGVFFISLSAFMAIYLNSRSLEGPA
jgi:hypothetical protein